MAFLGPNGAGMTTTLRQLLSLSRPNAGHVRLFGHDLAEGPVAALAGVAGIIEEPASTRISADAKYLRALAAFDRHGLFAAGRIVDRLASLSSVIRALTGKEARNRFNVGRNS
jgi:ABC-type cobalamin/Fe3+-siderophores transport system ATPase subunit